MQTAFNSISKTGVKYTVNQKAKYLETFFETSNVRYQSKVGFFVNTTKQINNLEVLMGIAEDLDLKVKIFGLAQDGKSVQIFLENA